jgi:hypothetical protein
MAENLATLNLVNKRSKARFSEEEWRLFEQTRMEAYDAILCAAIWIIVGAQTYGIDMAQETQKHRDKLYAMGYAKRKAASKAAR